MSDTHTPIRLHRVKDCMIEWIVILPALDVEREVAACTDRWGEGIVAPLHAAIDCVRARYPAPVMLVLSETVGGAGGDYAAHAGSLAAADEATDPAGVMVRGLCPGSALRGLVERLSALEQA